MSVLRRRSALGLIGASALLPTLPQPVRSQDLTHVLVGASLDDGLTPLLYAMQTGLFSSAGLNVELQQSQSGAALAIAVAGGAIDIAKSALMSLISAYDRGVHFKLVAPAALYVTTHNPTDELLVSKDSDIKSLADANGKVVVVSALQSFDQLATRAAIDKAGGNSSTVTFMEMPFIAMPLALQQKRADVISIGNPFLAKVLSAGSTRSFGDPYGAIGDHFLEAGWFSTSDYARKNPSVISRFASVMEKANAYCNVHHNETAPILAKYSGIEPEVVLKMTRITFAPNLQAKDIQPAIDAAYKYKYIHQYFAASELLL
jgi:NitT/TauT family transport system substrate-binding protein